MMEDHKLETAAPATATVTAAPEPTATATATDTAPAPQPQQQQEALSKTDNEPPVKLEETVPAAEKTDGVATSSPGSLDIEKNKPQDFEGEILTNHELPSAEVLKKVEDYIVLDREGKSHTFKSLYSGHNIARRMLVIFVRHFFCGNCQEYLRTLSETITTDSLLRLPVSTFITVIGCGDPGLIDMYVAESKCAFPVYTDPTSSLFDSLGMVKTLALGTKPAYIKNSLARGILAGISQGLRAMPKGLALKSGDNRQVGGEFLFEPLDLATPMATPLDERPNMGTIGDQGQLDESERPVEEKRVTWCHRMKKTRDHAEIPELKKVLGLDA